MAFPIYERAMGTILTAALHYERMSNATMLLLGLQFLTHTVSEAWCTVPKAIFSAAATIGASIYGSSWSGPRLSALKRQFLRTKHRGMS